MISLVIKPFSGYRKTTHVCIFSFGRVSSQYEVWWQLMSLASTFSITIILVFLFSHAFNYSHFHALFFHCYVRWHVEIHWSSVYISDTDQHIHVLISKFYNMPLENDQLSSRFPIKCLCKSCTLLRNQSSLSCYPNTPSGSGFEVYQYLHLA